ncbi:MAG: 2-C-methyl-D-erythritol 2,4-cyclodiphosphate synthase [Candidatus Omnitrophica bacterium]|nr:2-C-methyl-D-erythritol 2,4-cyclodiphosphate synthase [Candidatus Omnitrophota bacterium]MDD5487648.1 2-C-methyl-D-erythritol 2,4-cyclodiphosphate synthase [Candidatus Omnitrophota bacterium]
MKIGIGYDIHRLDKGRQMVIGGVKIPCDRGPIGHSDGDVLLHALCDAILGAMGEGDIGMKFPDTDPRYKDASSMGFLDEVAGSMRGKGFKPGNVDCIVITEEPRLGPYRDGMKKNISVALGIRQDDVNIKGKTSEAMGDIGEKKAMAAYVVVTLIKE